MLQIYDKDECAPDALNAKQWLISQDIKTEKLVAWVQDDEFYTLLADLNAVKTYLVSYFCGVYETVFLLEPEEAQGLIKRLVEVVGTQQQQGEAKGDEQNL
jgi:hypothetical protein